MLSWINLIMIIIGLNYFYFVNCQIDTVKRSLQDWSAIEDCLRCNSATNWVYLNNSCQPEISDLQSIHILGSASKNFWHQSLGDEFISLRSHDYNLDLYAYDNASLATNPLCQWRMLSADDK